MGRLTYSELEPYPERHLALTSLTPEEFAELLPPFEAAFQAHMADWCLDGKPRTARRYTTYKNCPLPTTSERLLFILVFVKTNPLQEAHGLMFRLPQGKTNMWIHTLLTVVRNALRISGDAPSRNLADLARRVDTTTEAPPQADVVSAPLFVTMAQSDGLAVRKTRASNRAAIVARKSAIQSRISC